MPQLFIADSAGWDRPSETRLLQVFQGPAERKRYGNIGAVRTIKRKRKRNRNKGLRDFFSQNLGERINRDNQKTGRPFQRHRQVAGGLSKRPRNEDDEGSSIQLLGVLGLRAVCDGHLQLL